MNTTDTPLVKLPQDLDVFLEDILHDLGHDYNFYQDDEDTLGR